MYFEVFLFLPHLNVILLIFERWPSNATHGHVYFFAGAPAVIRLTGTFDNPQPSSIVSRRPLTVQSGAVAFRVLVTP